MKSALISLLFLMLFTSCLVIKIYKSPHTSSEKTKKKHQTQYETIGSGKVINLSNGVNKEIMFHGNTISPKGYLFEAETSEKEYQLSDKILVWVLTGKNEKIQIFIKEETEPLVIIDGKVHDYLEAINSIDSDIIKSIKVFKGEASIKKYGDKGLNGAVEIITKK